MRRAISTRIAATLALLLACGCSTLPSTHYRKYTFPKNTYVGDMKARPYTVVGQVRSREDYQSLDQEHDEDDLCKNYFNKGARDLLKLARAQNADAVILIKSVTFNADGTTQTYDSPQCADDGQSGQILMEGTAINWGKAPLSGLAPSVALIKPSSAEFRALLLKNGEDGMDGGVYATSSTVVLYTMDRKVLAQIPIPSAFSEAWLTTEFLRSPKARTILINNRDVSGDRLTRPMTIESTRLSLIRATDIATHKSEPITLLRGKNADWRLTATQPSDFVQISSSGGTATYTRYRLDPKSGNWMKISSTAPGDWDPSKPFPPENGFPKPDQLPK